jgi:MFS family permease
MPSEPPTRGRAALAHRDFVLYQLARFFLTLATQMQAVAIAWQVYEITRRPVDLGYVGLAEFLPVFSLSLVAGNVADRVDRLRIVTTASVVVSACAAALFVLARAGAASVAPIYAVIVVFGVARAFMAPASSALLPSLVPPEVFPNAVAWSSTTWQVATIAGPAAGGFVYGVAGAQGVYVVAGVLALASAAAQRAVRPRPVPVDPGVREDRVRAFLAGIRYVRENRALLGSISLDLFAVLLGGATALLPVFASDVLHVGSFGLGVLRSAPGVGAAVMALVLAYRPLTGKTGPIMLFCVAVFGVATIVFGLSKSVALSLGSLLVLGAADMVSVTVRSTIVQIRTPPQMRGRVSAVNSMFIVASNELGEFESGLTAAWFGTIPAVVIGGVGSVVVVAMYAWLFPELRAIDRLDA